MRILTLWVVTAEEAPPEARHHLQDLVLSLCNSTQLLLLVLQAAQLNCSSSPRAGAKYEGKPLQSPTPQPGKGNQPLWVCQERTPSDQPSFPLWQPGRGQAVAQDLCGLHRDPLQAHRTLWAQCPSLWLSMKAALFSPYQFPVFTSFIFLNSVSFYFCTCSAAYQLPEQCANSGMPCTPSPIQWTSWKRAGSTVGVDIFSHIAHPSAHSSTFPLLLSVLVSSDSAPVSGGCRGCAGTRVICQQHLNTSCVSNQLRALSACLF